MNETTILGDDLLREVEQTKALQKLTLHIQKSPLAVIDWDMNFCVAEWNPAAEKIFGYSKDQAMGQHASFIIPEAHHQHVDVVWNKLLQDLGGSRSTNENVNSQGDILTCEWYNTPIVDTAGDVVAVSSLAQDVTEQVNYLRSLQFQAHHDRLTKLYNREWLTAFIDDAIVSRAEIEFCLYFIDLNHFKEINDTLGHDIGDAMLIILSQRLVQSIDGKNYKVARLGGDEFAVLADDTNIVGITNQIMQALEAPVELSGLKLVVGAGIGIARYPAHGRDAGSLMRCADIAMYYAKENNRRYIEYSTEIDNHSPDRLMLMNDLRNAINDNQLVLYYQPKIDVTYREHVGYEALLRWQHPERGLVYPDAFIPYAEITDLIHPLTMWVIEHALMQCLQWTKQGLNNNVSINLSARNLLDEQLPDKLEVLLDVYGIEPSTIELEITESAVMTDPDKALENMKRLRALGVLISIDDFGTGYSSMSYLRKMPIHKLKIDRAFVLEMETSHEDRIIVESMINLAHNLGLKVVAEGVENQVVLSLLDGLGCDEAQGHYISRPLPLEKLWKIGCLNK